jgi:hypothetical protein
MNEHYPKSERMSELSKQEQELLIYYRSLTTFNQRRVVTIARNAYEDAQRTMSFRANNYLGHK